MTDLEQLERALKSVTEMLDRVLVYVQSVLAGEVKGDAALGRYLMDAFGASTDELEKGGFNTSLQVGSYCRLCTESENADEGGLGHTHAFIFGEPRTVASRSLIQIGIGDRALDCTPPPSR